MKRKSILKRLLLLTMIGVAQFSIAQGNGVGGINEATRMVTSYFDPATKAHLCHRGCGGTHRWGEGV